LNAGRFTTVTQEPENVNEDLLLMNFIDYGYNTYGGACKGFKGLGLGGLDKYTSSHATPDSAVVTPSNMLASGDIFSRSRQQAFDGYGGDDMTIAPFVAIVNWSPSGKQSPKRQPGFIAHHGRANRVFVDGHLESEDMRKPFAATDEQLRHWNIDNQPHRDLLGNF
jgi:prepilin-type processing-associated H-X9-DG protein